MAEKHICGVTKPLNDEKEWVCVREPHPPKKIDAYYHQGAVEVPNHYFRAFKRSREKPSL